MHHANVIIGNEDYKEALFEILEKNLNFQINANPDFLLIEKELLGIDDARDLEKWSIGKPFLSDTKVSLISIKSITHEAQNALLKVLEEPTLGTYFFIRLESLGGILPTFLSRVRIMDEFQTKNDVVSTESAKTKFLHSSLKERFAIIRSLAKKEDKSALRDLIKDLEQFAYSNQIKTINLKKLLTAKIFASSRGASPKMLLEWLACML